jgi:hypothetical protein
LSITLADRKSLPPDQVDQLVSGIEQLGSREFARAAARVSGEPHFPAPSQVSVLCRIINETVPGFACDPALYSEFACVLANGPQASAASLGEHFKTTFF